MFVRGDRIGRWCRTRGAHWLSAVLAFAGVLGSATLLRAQEPTPGVVYACVKVNQGQVRVVSAPGSCRPSEKEVTWNLSGDSGSPPDLSGYAKLVGGNMFAGHQQVSGTVGASDGQTSALLAGGFSGVSGVSNVVAGHTSGVYGSAESSRFGTGVVGRGTMIGLFGVAGGTPENGYSTTGVVGEATGSLAGLAYGVQGFGRGGKAIGVGAMGTVGGLGAWAESPDASFGVHAGLNSATGNAVRAVNNADGPGAGPPAVTVFASARNDFEGRATSNSVAVAADATGANSVGLRAYGGSGTGAAGEFNNMTGGVLLRGSGGVPAQPDGTFQFTGWFAINGDGSASFSGPISAANFQSEGADFAESMDVAGEKADYEPGDVLAIDAASDRRLVKAAGAYNGSVAGIYATKPGILASPYPAGDPSLADDVPLAIVGIVPCKVTAANGAIARGDLLVVSDVPGYAMKGTDRSRLVGSVVGKALQPLSSGTGTILVLVTLQ